MTVNYRRTQTGVTAWPWCGNKLHRMTPENTQVERRRGVEKLACKTCYYQYRHREKARTRGWPFCRNGHGLVPANIDADKMCAVCGEPPTRPFPRDPHDRSRTGKKTPPVVLAPIPVPGPLLQPPPPAGWLDWAIVWQAFDGGTRTVRELTNYEVVCLVTTVMRRNDLTRRAACDWISDNTCVSVSQRRGEWLLQQWVRRAGLPPLTVGEALARDMAGGTGQLGATAA